MSAICKGCLATLLALSAAIAVADSETRDLTGFDRVLFALPGELTLRQGGDFQVVVDAEPEDLKRITTEVSGRSLAVRWKDGVFGMFGGNAEGPIRVEVTLPTLTALEVAGSGNADAGTWLTDSLELEVNGSGSVRFAELATEELTLDVSGSGNVHIAQLDCAVARIEVHGSGDVELSGAADHQEIEVMGSGDVDVRNLEGSRVEVEIMGSGDVAVWANEQLDAEIMGSGDVRYRGSPSVDREEHGSGEVKPL